MIDDRPKPGDRVALIDPSNGEILFKGTVRKDPKDASVLRKAVWSYVQFDGIPEPQWQRTSRLQILERKVQKSGDGLGDIEIPGTIGIRQNSGTPIFLAPKPR
jgi:hypothetical protein